MGITYNQEEKKFVFDFQHDGKEDIISLIGGGYQVEAFGKCFYYGYEFTEQVETSVRSAIYLFAQPSLHKMEELFADKADEELCASIRKQNVLIIDDVTTSGSTLNEILRTLRILNEDNDITIFSLIGRKDLMAEAF